MSKNKRGITSLPTEKQWRNLKKKEERIAKAERYNHRIADTKEVLEAPIRCFGGPRPSRLNLKGPGVLVRIADRAKQLEGQRIRHARVMALKTDPVLQAWA